MTSANSPAVDKIRPTERDSTAVDFKSIPLDGMALIPHGLADKRRYLSVTAGFFGIFSLLVSSGCGVSNATTLVANGEAVVVNLGIDADMISTDRSSYLCLFINRFGIFSPVTD